MSVDAPEPGSAAEPQAGQSALDPVFIAAGLGVGGPALMVAVAVLVAVPAALLGLPDVVALLLVLVVGQYLAFGGWALGYLRSRGLGWGDVRSYLGVRLPSLRELVLVLLAWVGTFVLLFVILAVVQAIGAQPAENEIGQPIQAAPELALLLIPVMFLVVGPAEELLYRGVVQGRLRESYGPVPAILLAAAIFALVHWVALSGSGGARLLTVAILLVPAIVFGAVYEYTGNLVVPALLHGLHNSVLLVLFYIALQYQDQLSAVLV